VVCDFIVKDRSAFGLPGSCDAEVVSFKIRDKMLADFMTQQPGYLRGFPAGNWNWTSAVIDGTITFEDICRWMDESYAATKTKTKTRERHCRKKSSREWMDSMSFFELASERYSERYFDSRPVEQEKIDKILEAGRTSPTACNYQPSASI
jgi:Nitroreductase